jgi:glycosyltransferase involved in cell wall biosynthesis
MAHAKDVLVYADIIHAAITLVFPSLYEGFGLPPFEAAFLDTPAICSTRPAMTELLEHACLFCDPDDPKQWANAIDQYASDAQLREKMASKAKAIAQQLSWKKSAQNFVKVLNNMA